MMQFYKEDEQEQEVSPAQTLIGSFLVHSHHVHQLQTCTLQKSPKFNGNHHKKIRWINKRLLKETEKKEK